MRRIAYSAGCAEAADEIDSVAGVPCSQPVYRTEGSWDHLDDREVLCVLANYDGTKKVGTGENAGV